MRIQKLLIISLVIGSSLNVAFSQTAAQADDQLIEILRKKQAELDARDASGQSSPTVAPKSRTGEVKEKQPQPPPVNKPAPVAIEPAPRAPIAPTVKPAPRNVATDSQKVISQPSSDSAAENRLVEILRKKQAELDAKESSSPSAPAMEKAVEVKKPSIAAKPPTKEQEDSEKRIKRIEAEIKAKEDAVKKTEVVSRPQPQPQPQPAPVQIVKPAPPRTETRVQAPSSTPEISSKQSRLAELLRRYKADEITPRDYHLERAKIVAEP